MYENWKIEKDKIWNYTPEVGEENPYQKEYSLVAEWCNENQQYTIQEDGDYYKVVPIPEPTTEEKAEQVRQLRDQYLQTYVDPLVTNPLRWADLTEQEQENIKAYRQYLLDIPQQEEFPDIEVKAYEEYKNSVDNSTNNDIID